jgi:FkbM family methyltransferase
VLKKLAGMLPTGTQQSLKRLHFGLLIRAGLFMAAEPQDTEFDRLDRWVSAGDWAVDVGANVGNYTARLSQLVGANGRVISIEPVPETFELLITNLARFPLRNVTFLNVAASAGTSIQGMSMPLLDSGMANRYMAHISSGATDLSVLTVSLDALRLPHPIRLVKVDVEGHELLALRGMDGLLRRDHPVLIVEGEADEVAAYLEGFGYRFEHTPGSPNRVFLPDTSPTAHNV